MVCYVVHSKTCWIWILFFWNCYWLRVEFWPFFPRSVPLATNVMKIGMLGAQNGKLLSVVNGGILRRMDQTENIISRVVHVRLCTNLAQTASDNTGTCWHRLQRVSLFRAARPQGCLPELLAVWFSDGRLVTMFERPHGSRLSWTRTTAAAINHDLLSITAKNQRITNNIHNGQRGKRTCPMSHVWCTVHYQARL